MKNTRVLPLPRACGIEKAHRDKAVGVMYARRVYRRDPCIHESLTVYTYVYMYIYMYIYAQYVCMNIHLQTMLLAASIYARRSLPSRDKITYQTTVLKPVAPATPLLTRAVFFHAPMAAAASRCPKAKHVLPCRGVESPSHRAQAYAVLPCTYTSHVPKLLV